MIYGYARVSTDGQSAAAQVAAFRRHGARKVFREVESGAKADTGRSFDDCSTSLTPATCSW
jgi:DNA invertase Pin-like site-specific DNA recombinase